MASFLGYLNLFLVRPSTDWMKLIHIIEGNLNYSNFTDLNTSTNTFTTTSRPVFDQITGQYGLAKLTHETKHHTS